MFSRDQNTTIYPLLDFFSEYFNLMKAILVKYEKNIYKKYTFERKTDFFSQNITGMIFITTYFFERDGKRHKTKYDSNDLTGQKHDNLILY